MSQPGLRIVLTQPEQKASYQWPDLSVGGEGLSPEVEEGGWERVRDDLVAMGAPSGDALIRHLGQALDEVRREWIAAGAFSAPS